MRNRVLIIIIIIIFYSCKFQRENSKTTQQKVIDTMLLKTVAFPKSLYKIEGNKFEKIDSFLNTIKNKPKIISIVDGTCMKCVINQLNVLDSIFNNILVNDRTNLIFILNVNKEDLSFFMKNLYPAIKAKGTILLDDNYNFESYNKLFTYDTNMRTIMVNDKNRIILYGNPLFDSKKIYEYQKLIK